MKIEIDTGFPRLDRAMRFVVVLNMAGVLAVVLWYIIETYTENTRYSIYLIENTHTAVIKVIMLIALSVMVYNTFFIKRCKMCGRGLDGYYLLSESRTKGERVCKKCFDSPDVWQKYFKTQKKN